MAKGNLFDSLHALYDDICISVLNPCFFNIILIWSNWTETDLLDVVGGEGEPGFRKPSSVSSYDEAMDALSSLITKKNRADKIVVDHRYELMFEYVKVALTTLTLYCNLIFEL